MEGNGIRILQDLGPACTASINTLRSTLGRIMSDGQPGNPGNANPTELARLIHFFAAVSSKPTQDTASSSLSSAFVGVYLNTTDVSASTAPSEWNLEVIATVMQDYVNVNWKAVARSFDFPQFKVRDVRHAEVIHFLYRSGATAALNTGQIVVLPITLLTEDWVNREGQLSLLENLLRLPPTTYEFVVDSEEQKDAATVFQDGKLVATNCANPSGWACARVLQRLLIISDDSKNLHDQVRQVFIMGLLSCPEIILCALVRLQLTVARAAEGAASNLSSSSISAGMPMKGELMRELIPLFFKPNTKHVVRNLHGAVRRLWEISQNTVVAASIEAFRSTSAEVQSVRYQTMVHIIGVLRVVPAPEVAIATILNNNKDLDFSFTMAFIMADLDMLQLEPWLKERFTSAGQNNVMFVVAILTFVGKNYATASPRSATEKPLYSIENIKITLEFIIGLDNNVLKNMVPAQGKALTIAETLETISKACANRHPALQDVLKKVKTINMKTGKTTTASDSQDDIEEAANQYFQQIYQSEESAREVVKKLKQFKVSGSARENDIFACMIHNLFDEYRFFSKYPEKELRITGILFGLLIKEQLVSSITLGIALRYVLEALRKNPNNNLQSGKMFRFGMFALEQFKNRLHEWPQYCSHIIQIPHLKDGYAALVGEIEGAVDDNQSAASSTAASAAGAATTSSATEAGRKGTPAPASSTDSSAPPPNQVSIGGFTGGIAASLNSLSSAGNTGPSKIDLPAPAIPLKDRRKAVFGPDLGRAVNAPEKSDESDSDKNEAPPDAVLDRVQFLVNNLSMSNCKEKSNDLREILDRKYFGWLGNFLVVKRISTQPNFHALYLSFLENLGEYGRGLVEAILASVYVNVGKLLRSQKITTSTSERSLLKNLGSWLGQITLARNRPILQIMLDCKELLLQGYETGMLIAVTPFVAKILEGAKNSIVFRPPNPWLMGLLSVFRALYCVDDLKMNIKFEVEVLCKNLGVKLEDVPMRTDLSTRVPPVKEKNPDFNLKASSAAATPSKAGQGGSGFNANAMMPSPDNKSSSASTGGDSTRSDGTSAADDQQQTVIPNLAAYVNVNPNLTQLFLQVQGGPLANNISADVLRKTVPIAVDRAIREIIQPVVERSVSIACITTKSIVTKDFAMESDENKMRKAAQLMVANLAGSLALVTCREPLHTSISSHLRQLLTTAINNASAGTTVQLRDQETSALDQCVAICSTENLELGCMLIEKAATEKAVRDMDETLARDLQVRKTSREKTGQPYYDMSIFSVDGQRYPKELPDALRPKPGGLSSQQLMIYEGFQRTPRLPAPAQSSDLTPGIGSDSATSDGSSLASPTGQINMGAMNAIALKLDKSVSTLLISAGPRAQEIHLSMIPAEHEIKQLIAAIPRVVNTSNRSLTSAETDLILSFSQVIFKRLYEVSLNERLKLEALIAMLELLNKACPALGRDMCTWATYAPTKTDGQRKLHRAVLLLLVRSSLIKMEDLDGHLVNNIDEGRDQVWLEFLFLFVRTACLEKIGTPATMPKMTDVIRKIAVDKSPWIPDAFQKAALRLIEELRNSGINLETDVLSPKAHVATLQESSSISPESLSTLSGASLAIAKSSQVFSSTDPPNARSLVTEILVQWLRVHSEAAGNEQVLAQFLHRLQQQFGVGTSDAQTERFLRLTMEVVVESCVKNAEGGAGLNYQAVDGAVKMLSYLVKFTSDGGATDQGQHRLVLLNNVLGVAARSCATSYEKAQQLKTPWDQRPWFRLLLEMLTELTQNDQNLDSIKGGMVAMFGSAFHVLQPLVVPGFSFAWLELISHRLFIGNLLLPKDRKGWAVMHELLIDLFLFMEPHLGKVELTPALRQFYDGVLRVVLMIMHDFPDFIAAYHLSLCNVLPVTCIQLRNLILSALPKGVQLPDPVSTQFKIDKLKEITQSPLILSNVTGPINGFKSSIDGFLSKQQPSNLLLNLHSLVRMDGKSDAPVVNSLVLYVGMKGIARLQSEVESSVGHSPEMEVFHKLMEADDFSRYITLNAIANQLRYPNSHTHYFSCVMLCLFNESKESVKEQITRVLLERLITQRPHPFGLLTCFIELIKNTKYDFWSHSFTRCSSEIERVFQNVASSVGSTAGDSTHNQIARVSGITQTA